MPDYIGFLPFVEIGQEPHGASVYASQDIELAVIDDKMLNTEYYRQSNTLKNLLEHTAGCISITTQLVLDTYMKAKEERRRG